MDSESLVAESNVAAQPAGKGERSTGQPGKEPAHKLELSAKEILDEVRAFGISVNVSLLILWG